VHNRNNRFLVILLVPSAFRLYPNQALTPGLLVSEHACKADTGVGEKGHRREEAGLHLGHVPTRLRSDDHGRRPSVLAGSYKQHGVSRRRSLPGVVDLGAARKPAKAILGAAAAGRDPIGERHQQAREAKNTLQFIHSEYFAVKAPSLKASIARSGSGNG
jgi:hypothetical protein